MLVYGECECFVMHPFRHAPVVKNSVFLALEC